MKTYRCKKCGYEKESAFDEGLECPLCRTKLIVGIDENTQDEQVLELIVEKELEIMKDTIREAGSDIVWHKIEKIDDAKERVNERAIFIKVGGIVPRSLEIRI